jgi:hypothetical protein
MTDEAQILVQERDEECQQHHKVKYRKDGLQFRRQGAVVQGNRLHLVTSPILGIEFSQNSVLI